MICRNRIIVLASLTILFSVQYVRCNDNDLDLDLSKMNLDKIKFDNLNLSSIDWNEVKQNLPAGIEIPASLQNVTLPSVDELKAALKEKCSKVSGGDAAYESIERGVEDLRNCTSGLIDFEEFQKEMNEAKPKGELDTVFNKYCRKRHIAIGCMQNFTTVVEPCLEPAEIDGKRTFVKIFESLLNFVCYKDGDQIALFIAEKGPECFSDRKDAIIHCVNATVHSYLPSSKDIDESKPSEFPQLVIGKSQCNDMDVLQSCIVKSLESCEESTPANLVDSLFKFIKNETPCANLTSNGLNGKNPNNGNINNLSTTVFATILTFFAMKSILA